jgi:plasmid stabilization system protein ParE
MRVTYHPHAEAELIEAAQYYESRVEGLGKRFLAESDQAVSLIREAPQRWRIVEADVRRYLMPHFPFAIYYRALQDHVRILAFKHHSRHPDYWRYRTE